MLAGCSRAGWSEWHLQLLSQITSPSSVGIPTSVRRAERVQDKNMGYKGNPLFAKSFHAAVGLNEVARHPQVQKEERVSWPRDSCSLQKVILIPDVTLDGRQGAGTPNSGLGELLPHPSLSSQERILRTLRTHGQVGSTRPARQSVPEGRQTP